MSSPTDPAPAPAPPALPPPPRFDGSEQPMGTAARLNPELMQILRCPACRFEFQPRGDWLGCTNPACQRHYPVTEFPILVIDEAITPPGHVPCEPVK